MQNFLSLWLNAGAQITHGGQVQRPRQKKTFVHIRKTGKGFPLDISHKKFNKNAAKVEPVWSSGKSVTPGTIIVF